MDFKIRVFRKSEITVKTSFAGINFRGSWIQVHSFNMLHKISLIRCFVITLLAKIYFPPNGSFTLMENHKTITSCNLVMSMLIQNMLLQIPPSLEIFITQFTLDL